MVLEFAVVIGDGSAGVVRQKVIFHSWSESSNEYLRDAQIKQTSQFAGDFINRRPLHLRDLMVEKVIVCFVLVAFITLITSKTSHWLTAVKRIK